MAGAAALGAAPSGLIIFAVLTVVAALPLVRLRWPSVHDGLRRLDRGSGETHRPASAIADEIASNENDPVTQALWRAHIERALMSARKLKAGWPQPKLALRDPMALRALVLILVVAGFFAGSGERVKRITAAFDWQGVVAPANFRVDAWVTPPLYTGRPPVMLPGLRPGETAQAAGPVAVPVGSQLVVRATGNVHFDVAHKGGLEDRRARRAYGFAGGHRGAPLHHQRRRLGGAARRCRHRSHLELHRHSRPGADDLAAQGSGAAGARRACASTTRWRMITASSARKRRLHARLTPMQRPGKPAHPLYEAPVIPLTLPQARTRSGAAQTTHDLTEHPWAGAEVTMTLVARDEAGNEGRSEPHDFELPQRVFVKPVARALIEQRRDLALDANQKPVVLTALDALTIAPEIFIPEAGVYLGLRSIYYDLGRAKSDDALREVVARMWAMAVQIEDGNVSEAEQALRQAQDALRDALDRNASDEEIKKLTDQLRAALDKFLQALAEQMRKNPQQLSRPLDRTRACSASRTSRA